MVIHYHAFKFRLHFFFFFNFSGDEDTKRPTRMQQPLNSESILTKEQLYDMLQQILSVKKFEHQILYNALMVSIFISFILFFTLFSFYNSILYEWRYNKH